jgi:hypothetical protein
MGPMLKGFGSCWTIWFLNHFRKLVREPDASQITKNFSDTWIDHLICLLDAICIENMNFSFCVLVFRSQMYLLIFMLYLDHVVYFQKSSNFFQITIDSQCVTLWCRTFTCYIQSGFQVIRRTMGRWELHRSKQNTRNKRFLQTFIIQSCITGL